MTKKSIKPQQAAPVQREINTTSSAEGGSVTPSYSTGGGLLGVSFAGDDAE